MQSEQEIKTEVRLYAIEIFVANLLSISCLSTSAPKAVIDQMRLQLRQGANKPLIGLDAAMSDMISAELESAVDRLAGMASEQIDSTLKHAQGKA